MILKDNGLQIQFCTNTGLCNLRYYYPICEKHIDYFEKVKLDLGITVKKIGKQCFAIYVANGNSTSVISSFRTIKKSLKILSRTTKIIEISKELEYIQAKSI